MEELKQITKVISLSETDEESFIKVFIFDFITILRFIVFCQIIKIVGKKNDLS